MNDYEVVVRGLARMLEPFKERIEIVELAIAAPSTALVDVALYDTFAADMVFGREVKAERFVIYTWRPRTFRLRGPRERRRRRAVQVTESRRARGGARADPRMESSSHHRQRRERVERDWPARRLGLSEREAEIVSLITHGLGNDDIADRLFLSINTVKSYIRTAYRKMGVTSRSQAVPVGSRPRLHEAHPSGCGPRTHPVRGIAVAAVTRLRHGAGPSTQVGGSRRSAPASPLRHPQFCGRAGRGVSFVPRPGD